MTPITLDTIVPTMRKTQNLAPSKPLLDEHKRVVRRGILAGTLDNPSKAHSAFQEAGSRATKAKHDKFYHETQGKLEGATGKAFRLAAVGLLWDQQDLLCDIGDAIDRIVPDGPATIRRVLELESKLYEALKASDKYPGAVGDVIADVLGELEDVLDAKDCLKFLAVMVKLYPEDAVPDGD